MCSVLGRVGVVLNLEGGPVGRNTGILLAMKEEKKGLLRAVDWPQIGIRLE